MVSIGGVGVGVVRGLDRITYGRVEHIILWKSVRT